VTVKGALAVVGPAVSRSPEGFDPKVRFTVLGWRLTPAVAVRPPESLAVSWSSRYDG
jgi:hypothetical protein